MLEKSDCFIVLGQKWKQKVHNINPDTNIVIASNSVKIPKNLMHNSTNTFKILYLGVLIKRKGVYDLLDAYSNVINNTRSAQIKLLIAGSGDEEPLLKKYSDSLGMNEQQVEFLGWIDKGQKDILLRECQLMVLTSYNEGLPVCILEALSYGIPVISTDVGDISEAVKDGYNGYLVKPGDIIATAEKMEHIIMNKSLHEKMCNNARKHAEDIFSEEQYYEKIVELYTDISAKRI